MGDQVSKKGILTAVFMSLAATIGERFTADGYFNHFDVVWLAMFGLSIFTLAAAAVNFDVRRWLV